MSSTADNEPTVQRLDVASADGTPLAVWVCGDAPPIVLVHGSPSDHHTFDPLVTELRGSFTIHAMDRRGSGASGDMPSSFAIQREFEDVAAVADFIAATTGTPAVLFGHSYEANCAMGAATLTPNVQHLVLYEPSLGLAYPAGAIDSVERAVAAVTPTRRSS